jgi:hypothetical protein
VKARLLRQIGDTGSTPHGCPHLAVVWPLLLQLPNESHLGNIVCADEKSVKLGQAAPTEMIRVSINSKDSDLYFQERQGVWP